MSTPIIVEANGLSAPPYLRSAVSFTIRAGERVCLYGLCGAGKSALLKAIAARRHPTDQARWYIARSACGYAAQQPRMIPGTTVLQHLVWCACLHGQAISARSSYIYQMLELFDLSAKRQQPVSRLSPGEQAKLELCSAMLVANRLLIVDSLLDQLDERTCDRFWEFVDTRCARREMALLYATCTARQAELANWVIVLHQGRLLAADTPERLRAAVPPRVVNLSDVSTSKNSFSTQIPPTLADVLHRLIYQEGG